MGSFVRISLVSFVATMSIVGVGAGLQKSRQGPSQAAVLRPPVASLSMIGAAPTLSPVMGAFAISSTPVVPADPAAAALEGSPSELGLPQDADPDHPLSELGARDDGFDLEEPDLDGGQWAPPTWFPEEAREGLLALEGMNQAGPSSGPRLHSTAVFVYDVDAGKVLLSRHADDRRPVASLTKLLSALTVASEGPDLDRQLCIDSSSRPSWPGARTKLFTGTCGTGWDYLGAAVVQSDNGAAMVLPEVAGLPYFPFVSHMNEVAAELGMGWSSFVDPSGADDDNLSTARDMTRAALAASLHPTVATVATAPFWDFADTGRQRIRRMWTTDRMVGRQDIEVLAAKTGYTDTAGYCFTGVFRTRDGHRVAFTTLGAHRNRHRWKDVERLLDWAGDL